jgi:uncharacterized membrane protein
MEKDLNFYRKRSKLYMILCPVFLLITVVLLFIMNEMTKDANDWGIFNTPIGYTSIVFGILGLAFFILWQRSIRNVDNFLQKLKAEKREQEYNEIVKLIQLGQSQEAIDKLTKWKKS